MGGSLVPVPAENNRTVEGAQQRASGLNRVYTRFYGGMSGALLLIVLVGFSRTFYLRALFDVPEIPAAVAAHGVILTAWFVGFFLQTVLVAARRIDIHRRFGWLMGGIGLAVVASSTVVTLNFVPRQKALGVDIDAQITRLSSVVWTDLAALLTFSVLVLTAVARRRQPEWHKRLMLLASLSILSPALTRIWKWPVFAGLDPTLLSLGVLLLLLVTLGLSDVFSGRRIHPVTLVGGAFFIGVRTLATFGLANSGFGQAFIRGLG